MKRVRKLFITKAQIDEESKTVRFRISDNKADRDEERIDQKSWNFSEFMENPVVLWKHRSDEPEDVLGTADELDTTSSGDGYDESFATVKIDEDIHEKAQTVWKQLARGTLRCVSVGFVTGKQEVDEDGVTVLKDNTLLEISIVPIPANPRAMALAAKDGSLSRKDAKFLLDSMQKESKYLKEQLDIEEEKNEDEEPMETEKQLSTLTEQVTETNKNVAALAESVKTMVEAKHTKGAVADEVEDLKAQKLKWQKMEEAYNIWWAFVDLYYSDDSEVTDFQKLLGETAALLQELAGGTYSAADDDPTEGEEPATGKALAAKRITKALKAKADDAPADDDPGSGDKPKKDGDQDPAKPGDDDQGGAGGDEDDALDEDAEMTDEQKAEIDAAFDEAAKDDEENTNDTPEGGDR